MKGTFDGKTGASLNIGLEGQKVVYGRWSLRIPLRTAVGDTNWRIMESTVAHPGIEGSYTCAKIMFSLMTRHRHPDGKFLIAGGAIAQFYRCCSHVCHCDQSSGRFYVGVQGVHGQNLDSTSWSKLPRQDCVGLRQLDKGFICP